MPTTSITSASGRDFQIKVADPDVSPSVYAQIGGLRTTTFNINNNAVDITSVTSAGFTEWDPDGGIQNVSADIEGIFDSNTTGAQSLSKAAEQRVLVEANVVSGHGDSIFFAAVVTSFTRTGAHDNVETFSASLVSHGTINFG
jgi:predicted secreted protein